MVPVAYNNYRESNIFGSNNNNSNGKTIGYFNYSESETTGNAPSTFFFYRTTIKTTKIDT
jgi:hypothetical protein